MTGPEPEDLEADDDLYELVVPAGPRRAIAEELTEAAAWAVIDFLGGDLLKKPRIVGKPLGNELKGLHCARVGTYRVEYDIDEEQRTVKIVRIALRSDIYGIR